jgi:hypothetical protein
MRNKLLIVTAAMLTVAACGEPSPAPEATAPAPSAAATGVKPGTYKVCDVGQHSGHGSYTGEHLAIGDTIEIEEGGELVTGVTFQRTSAPPQKLWMFETRSAALASTQSYPHRQGAAPEEPVLHYVYIGPKPAQEAAGDCQGNIITVRFCVDKGSDLGPTCAPQPDYGHVHASN